MNQKALDKQLGKLESGNVLSRRAASLKIAQAKAPQTVPALMKACSDPDGIVQENAIQGLCAIGTPEALGFLKTKGIEVVGGKMQFADAAAAQEHAKRMMKTARVNMGVGAALLLVGVGITVSTYAAASSSSEGGTYYVTYGLIIIGAIGLVMGIYQYVKAKRQTA